MEQRPDNSKDMEMILKGIHEIVGESELKEWLESGKKLNIKFGIDPTAPDVHLGHTVPLRKLKQFQDLGHNIIILIGDFTAMIGDPTGKSQTRKELNREQVLKNTETYLVQIFKILDKSKTKIVFNSEWLSKLNFADVIKLASKCTVAKMLEREDFRNRYTNQQSISVHEFLYPLMQGYDSIALESNIELGGTDQKFNILMGRSLQKDYGQVPQAAIFMPILEGTDGIQKMSKSLGNYIGIEESSRDIFGKTMSIPDSMIVKYLNLVTDVKPSKIRKIENDIKENKLNPMDAKMELAYELVSLYYNTETAEEEKNYFINTFRNQKTPTDLKILKIDNSFKFEDNSANYDLIKIMISSKMVPSTSEARRLVKQGAVKLNSEKIQDLKCHIKNGDVLKIGKLKMLKLELE